MINNELSKHTAMPKTLYVGLDVHKDSITVAIASQGREDATLIGKFPNNLTTLQRHFAKWRQGSTRNGKPLDEEHTGPFDLKFVYEAGPCGFTLHRRLTQLGYDCTVVAPSLIPQSPGDKVNKTDKSDSKKLARGHRSGDLTPVYIPHEADEAIRDLCRLRSDTTSDLKGNKQRLKAFMLRNGYAYEGKTSWNESHMNYLRELTMPCSSQKAILEEYLTAITDGIERVARIEAHMERELENWHLKPVVEALMAFKGFKIVAAMITVSELGDFTRFTHPRQLMSYLGLVSSEHSSGPKQSLGGITKCGNGHLRWILVECAQHYAKEPKVSRQLSTRQRGQSRGVKNLSWKTQNRLHHRFENLRKRRMHRNKIIVAIARELSSFLWELGQLMLKEGTWPHHLTPTTNDSAN
jgi:transposase